MTSPLLGISSWGAGIADAFAVGMLEGLGHRMSSDRCTRCGDSRRDIQRRIADSRAEQLLFGEFRCSGEPE